MDRELRILLLEDIPSDAELAERELRKSLEDIDVCVVSNETEFVNALEDQKPDIVVSDYLMPSFSGMEALEISREKYPFIPFVILTGSMNEETAVECMKSGADDYVIKEHILRLAPAVRHAIEKKKTEKKHHEALQKIHNREQEYRLLVDNLQEGIWYIDNDANTVFVNSQMAQMLGYRVEEMLGKHFFSFMDEEGMKKATEYWERRKKGVKEQHEFTFQRKDGSPAHVLMATAPIYDDTGSFTGALAGIQDISELKQVQRKLDEYSKELEAKVEERTRSLREAQDKLLRREKLAALGQLAGTVAHELRNPFGVITNAAYYLKMTAAESNETTREYLDIIDTEISNATRIVSELLDFSRSKQPEKTSIDLREFLDAVISKLDIREGIELEINIPEKTPGIEADPNQLSQVMINLIDNSVQALPDTGKITIESFINDSDMIIEIHNMGDHIEKGNLDKVFEPLYTTRPRGIGLGLPICRNIVEAHGGHMELESEEGKGTVVRVALPME